MPKRMIALLAAGVFLAAGQAGAAAPKGFETRLSAFIDQLRASPHAPPGFVVVAIHGEDTVFAKAYGVRDVRTGAPVTLDTPIYNGSVTKAYTGLLAALLDESGELPLSSSLKDVWPQVTTPAPLKPAEVTVPRLLSHSSGLFEGGVMIRSNATGQITAAEVSDRISKYGRAFPQTFRYANFGPFVYSAMAETRSGEPWGRAVTRRVLKPLGLERTYVRVEDMPKGEAGACHARVGGRWVAQPPKPTPVLNAAGGMFASGRDTAAYLKAFASDGRTATGKVSPTTLRRTWAKVADQDQNLWGFHRDGYGLGWDLGTYGQHRFVARSGGYTGCRAIALFTPKDGFGVVVMTLGDMAANDLNAAIIQEALDLWSGTPGPGSEGRVAAYHATAAAAAARADPGDPRLKNPPALDPAVLAGAEGAYENVRLGRFVLARQATGWTFSAGAYTGDLVPQPGGEFVIVDRSDPAGVETFKPTRDAAGRLTGFLWDDDQYDRVGA